MCKTCLTNCMYIWPYQAYRSDQLMFFLVPLVLCETHAEVQEILVGNWTVHQTGISGKINEADFHVRIAETEIPSKITIHVYDSNQSTLPIHKYDALFHRTSKGKFRLVKSGSTFATFDFSPLLPPHISSSGDWGSSQTYTATMITNKVMQLTLFDKEGGAWRVLRFEKDATLPQAWYEKHFQLLFMVVAFIGSWCVTRIVQKCVMRKRTKEAEKIIAQQKKEQAKRKKK